MTQQIPSLPVSAADIEAAAKVVAPFAVRTPLLSFPVLDERAGTKVLLQIAEAISGGDGRVLRHGWLEPFVFLVIFLTELTVSSTRPDAQVIAIQPT